MRTKPLLLLLASCFLVGCASMQLPKSLPFGKKDPSAFRRQGDPVLPRLDLSRDPYAHRILPRGFPLPLRRAGRFMA